MTLLQRPEVDTGDLQLRFLAVFHTPVLGPVLRLGANNILRLNILVATDLEQWILKMRLCWC